MSDGGAISLSYGSNIESSFQACTFAGNRILGNGGGIQKGEAALTAVNCLFLGNSSLYGGGVYSYDDGTIVLTNCTFRRNYAHYLGTSVYAGFNTVDITNSILWGGLLPDGSSWETFFYYCTENVSYSDVNGGESGTGNIDSDPVFRPTPSGSTTALSFDAASFISTVTDESAAFSPGALAGMTLMIEHIEQYESPNGYLIVDNTDTAITVWGDVTDDGAVTSPREYEVLSWRVRGNSPCIDSGCDTSAAAYGSVTTDIEGDARGYDGAMDGPTGPPEPGDGSDYDMGADEYMGDDPILPDLEIESVTHTPSDPTAADVITLAVTVVNNGTADAGASKVQVEVEGEATPVTLDVPALAVGESETVERDVTLPEGTGYRIIATADIEGNVAEASEDNNTGEDTFDVLAGIACDIDGDGKVNATDVQLCINSALGIPISGNADVNGDSAVTAADVQLVINAALG